MNIQNVKNVGRLKYADVINHNLHSTSYDLTRIERLTEDKKAEVLNFLEVRPVHTVIMTSFIKDNGLENALNRGTYFGYRNKKGSLEGVALIGHSTLVEARSEESLAAFAITARQSEFQINVMMSEGDTIERFWKIYKQDGSKPRLSYTEKLFELNFPFPIQHCELNIRLGRAEEIEQIAEAHAEVAFIESGKNPMENDREGFIKRCLRRIEKDRTFVVFENDKLVFKADIVAETENVVYLEGIYVSPEYRGKGIGAKCLSKLSLILLDKVDNICMLSNEKFKCAHRSFEKAGYISKDSCITLFV